MSERAIPSIHGADHAPGAPDPIPPYGTAVYEIKVFEDVNLVVVGDGAFIWEIPEDLDGATLLAVEAFVTTVGSTTTEVQIRKVGVGDLLSTKLSIDAAELNSKDATVPAVIVSSGNEVLVWGEHLAIDVDAAGTGSKGLGVILAVAPTDISSFIVQGAQGPGGGVTDWLGQWQTGTGYTVGQAVSHDGVTYVAIVDHTSGASTEPGVGVDWADAWMLLVDDLAFYGGVQMVISAGAYPLDPGVKDHIPIPFDCEIIEATLLADAAGSCVVDLWSDTYGNHPPTDADSITGGSPLTLSSQNKTTNTTLTGWDTVLTAGDVLTVNVDSISGIALLTVALRLLRTGAGPAGGGGGGGSGTDFTQAIEQVGHGLAVADVVRLDGADYVLAQADSAINAEVVGIVTAVADADNFSILFGGWTDVLSGLTAGATYFLDPASAGALTATEPTAEGEVSKPLLVADTTTSGYFFNMRGLVLGAAGTGGGAASDPVFDVLGDPDTTFEFDSSSLTGLTALSPTPDVEDADTTVPGHYFLSDDASGTACCGRYATAPSAPFTAVTKISGASIRDDFNGVGIFIGAATPGAMDILFYGISSRYPHGNAFSNPTSFASNFWNPTGYAWHETPFYLAIRVNSSTDVDYLFSMDGLSWVKGVDSRDPSLTIGAVGLCLKSQNANGLSAAFDYLRIWNSAKAFPGVSA